ncbi:MAG: hypothetical protein AAFQ65_02610 [Myxococcota bacterium]
MSRCVRGVLFADYVRVLRANKGFDYSGYLDASDVQYLNSRIDEHGWYPMESFERLGLAILGEIIRGDLEMTKVWGHTTVELLSARYPELVEHSDPTETIRRFKVLQNSFFNFYPLQIREQLETEVRVQIGFGMGERAEEAASVQAQGFFERLATVTGGRDVRSRFISRSWEREPETLLHVRWLGRAETTK